MCHFCISAKTQRQNCHCDQMAILFFNLWPLTTIKFAQEVPLAIYNKENLPSIIRNCQRRYKSLPNTRSINHTINCPKTYNFAKEAKFHQIWSLCLSQRRVGDFLEVPNLRLPNVCCFSSTDWAKFHLFGKSF